MPDDRDIGHAPLVRRDQRLDGRALPSSTASLEGSEIDDVRRWYAAAHEELHLDLSFETFAAAVARDEPLPQHATEFYLALACAHSLDGAAECLLERYARTIGNAIRRMKLTAALFDDARARAFEIILVGEGSGPAIGRYRGRGSLAGWLKVASVRAAHRVLRSLPAPSAEPVRDEVNTMTTLWSPQERALLEDEGVILFRDTLRDVLNDLPPQERTILRLHYRDRMSIDALAEIWDVHRATAARRIARLRTSIRDAVLTRLQAEFGSSPSSVGRWVRRMRSRLGGFSSLLDRSGGSA